MTLKVSFILVILASVVILWMMVTGMMEDNTSVYVLNNYSTKPSLAPQDVFFPIKAVTRPFTIIFTLSNTTSKTNVCPKLCIYIDQLNIWIKLVLPYKLSSKMFTAYCNVPCLQNCTFIKAVDGNWHSTFTSIRQAYGTGLSIFLPNSRNQTPTDPHIDSKHFQTFIQNTFKFSLKLLFAFSNSLLFILDEQFIVTLCWYCDFQKKNSLRLCL